MVGASISCGCFIPIGKNVILVDRSEALRRYNTLRKSSVVLPTIYLTYSYVNAISDGCALEAKGTFPRILGKSGRFRGKKNLPQLYAWIGNFRGTKDLHPDYLWLKGCFSGERDLRPN